MFGLVATSMMMITNQKSNDKRLDTAVCKVYLMRLRIEEYFKFQKLSLDFVKLRVQSLKFIKNLDLLLSAAIWYVAEVSGKLENREKYREVIIVEELRRKADSGDSEAQYELSLCLRTRLHKHMRTSFRQILPQTALKILAGRKPACGFLSCLQQNYARKSAHISYEDRFLF